MPDSQTKPELLSDEALAEIEARANAATEGPWDWAYHPHTREVIALESNTVDVLLCTGNGDYSWGELSEHDAAFLKHARTDIPALIQTVRALRAQLQTKATLVISDIAKENNALREQYESAVTDFAVEINALREQLAGAQQRRDRDIQLIRDRAARYGDEEGLSRALGVLADEMENSE